ncbi:MAG: iron chelate uptake ABC transporter family permease subunit, partial [Longimicrobiales bacterium]
AYTVASLLVAATVAVCGVIGFIGLIVPHALRLLWGSDHRLLLPGSFLGGGAFLLLADTAARTLAAPAELPVGVVTALIGVPLFMLLLVRGRA